MHKPSRKARFGYGDIRTAFYQMPGKRIYLYKKKSAILGDLMRNVDSLVLRDKLVPILAGREPEQGLS
jgi:hypothetical protein